METDLRFEQRNNVQGEVKTENLLLIGVQVNQDDADFATQSTISA